MEFPDDHSVRKTFKPEKLVHHQELNTIAVIEKSMLDIKSWMDAVAMACFRLLHSGYDTEVMILVYDMETL